MEAIAKLKNVPTSTRKMRLIADLIRGKGVDLALNTLKFESKIGSKRMEKLLLSAISNWQEKNKDSKNMKDYEVVETIPSSYKPKPRGQKEQVLQKTLEAMEAHIQDNE